MKNIFKKKELTPEQLAKKKRNCRIRIIIDVIGILALIGWTIIPQFTSAIKIDGFENYAKNVSEVSEIKADIVALGEGTHGTKEFHQLKLSVFEELVDNGFRAFAIEGTFGDGEIINDYIQGGETTLDEAYYELSYRCYKTDEMKALIKWMRDYNDSHDEKVRFYGFDIQHFDNSSEHILKYLRGAGCGDVEEYASWLMEFDSPDGYYSEDEIENLLSRMDTLEALIESTKDEKSSEYRRAMEDCEVIKMGIELNRSSNAYTSDRDYYMAETLKWIIEEEKTYYGNTKIMLSAHDGHIAKGQTATYKTLGMYMSEELGDRYYALGTDFYKGRVNMPELGGRTRQEWNTADPLAAQMKYIDKDAAYIDFDSIPENEKIYKLINKKMSMGSLGESYNAIMHLFPNMYRINRVPTEFYDGMIVVYESSATKIKVD